MSKKQSFKEIRQQANEIIKRPPTSEQLENLKGTFVRIEKAQREETDSENEQRKKIARDPELGM